jgi:hypothetical protein
MKDQPEVRKFWIRTPKRVLPNGLATGNQKVTLVAWTQDPGGPIRYSRATCNPETSRKTGKRDQFDSARAHSEVAYKLLSRHDSFVVVDNPYFQIPNIDARSEAQERFEGESVKILIMRDIVSRSLRANRGNTLYAKTAIDALLEEKKMEESGQ